MSKYVDISKEKLVKHAKKVLEFETTGSNLAKELEMNTKQVYHYRNKSRSISNARIETLLKFEKVYHNMKNDGRLN